MMAAPSQAALATALNPVRGGETLLAEIHRERRPVAQDSVGVAKPPRSIITIVFLRN
jgi:hypothetical protein